MQVLGLHTQPFCEQPDGQEYFSDAVMKMQLNMLQHNLRFSDMLQILKGDAGSGKTALVIQMLSRANDELQIFIVRGKATLTAPQILLGMLKIFQLPIPDATQTCLELLIDHLKIRLEKNCSSVLIVENAHAISVDTLNQLLAYTDHINEVLDGELRILLVADPVIESILPKLTSAQLRAGKVFISSVRALDRQRTREYLEYRLQQAGFIGDLPFNDKQLRNLYDNTDGIPQQLDTVAASMLNQQTKPHSIGAFLQALPLRLIATAATSIIAIALLLFVVVEEPDEGGETAQSGQAMPTPITTTQTDTDAINAPLPDSQASTETPAVTQRSETDTSTANTFTSLHEVTPPAPVQKIILLPPKQVKEHTIEDTQPSTPPVKKRPAQRQPSQSAQWLLKQKPANYTIQLMASYDGNDLSEHIRNNSIESQTALFETSRNTRRWHVLTYGIYTSAGAARAAIAKLPNELRHNTPWVRSIESVQQEIVKHLP